MGARLNPIDLKFLGNVKIVLNKWYKNQKTAYFLLKYGNVVLT